MRIISMCNYKSRNMNIVMGDHKYKSIDHENPIVAEELRVLRDDMKLIRIVDVTLPTRKELSLEIQKKAEGYRNVREIDQAAEGTGRYTDTSNGKGKLPGKSKDSGSGSGSVSKRRNRKDKGGKVRGDSSEEGSAVEKDNDWGDNSIS